MRNTVVTSFYLRDDISRQSPGRKDYVTVKDVSGNDIRLQTKHLMFKLEDVFRKFCEENETCGIKLSLFCKLRPSHVLLMSQMPHNVCLCIYHDNFISAVNAISKAVPGFPKYDDEKFFKTFFCDVMIN